MNKKRILSIWIMFCFMLINLIMVVGCGMILPDYEEGFFTYKLVNKSKDDHAQVAIISGLTESGKQQEIIVVPKTIGGYPVKSLGENQGVGSVYGYWKSENLKRVYITHNINIMYGVFSKYRNRNLEKVTFIGYYQISVIDVNLNGVYLAKNLYVNLANKEYSGTYREGTFYRPANVTYYFNYETSEPIYWADDYDNELISFIPLDPAREGYTFGGWYKEAECINQWNFETDIVAAKKYDSYVCTYPIIELYAKWNLIV